MGSLQGPKVIAKVKIVKGVFMFSRRVGRDQGWGHDLKIRRVVKGL